MLRLSALIAMITAACLVSGCAAPLIAGLTLNELSSFTSFISTGLTGKGLGEHALDLATGDDCRIVETLLRDDREFCETRNSAATEKDFKGLIGMAAAEMKRQDLAAAAAEQENTDVAPLDYPSGLVVADGEKARGLVDYLAAAEAKEPIVVDSAPRPIQLASATSDLPPRPPTLPGFGVQVGTFLNADNAAALAKRLRTDGYTVLVGKHIDGQNRSWTIIRVAGFPDSRSAEKAAAALSRRQNSPMMVVKL
ncbi:MAG: SPOR domain-containing protein [Proteobacteria bacterium]|nr:SPOR domain-containing protein [Pseudomonadota bacterium]